MPPVPATDVRIIISATANDTIGTFRRIESRLGRLNRRVQDAALHFRRLDRIWSIIALFSGVALIKKFVEMGAEMQRIQFQIAALTQDFEGVPRVMDRLLETTSRVPFTLNTMAQSFVRLKASGIDPIVDDQGNGPLKAMADALAAFGGGDELFKRMTIAIQQMAGKGVISMEELRQQLGEAVPTAMRVMAEQMEISVAKLIQDVSRGRVEFEEGFDALIQGFEEKFGGLGEVMKNTFLGQLQQVVTEFQNLSEVLFVRSGAFDKFAAGLKLINQEIRNFANVLASPEGQKAIDDFWQALERVAIFAAQASAPFQHLISIIGDLAGIIANITGSLPAEIIGGGLLGFILFGGRAGLAAGALFGAFSTELAGVARLIARWVGDIFGFLKQLGLEDVAAGGLMGFILFGRKGSLIAAAGLFVDRTLAAINKLVTIAGAYFAAFIANTKEQLKAGLENPLDVIFNNDEIIARGEKAGKDAFRAFIKSAKEAGEFSDTFFGETSLFSAIGGGTEEGNKAVEVVQEFIDKMNNLAPSIAKAREEALRAGQAIQDIGGLSPTDITRIEKLGTFIERLERQAAGAGTQIGNLRAQIGQKLSVVDEVIGNVNKQIDKLGEGHSKIDGLRASIETLVGMKGEITSLGEAIIANMSAEQFEKTRQQVDRLNESFDEFLVGSEQGFSAQEFAVQKVEARFAGFNLRIQQLTKSVKDNIDVNHGQAEALKLLEALESKMNAARANAIRLTREQVELTRMKTEQDIAQGIISSETQVRLFELQNDLNEVAIAGLRAREQLDNAFQSIANQIQNVQERQQKGLITEEFATASIERLQELQTRLGELADKFVEIAEFNASEWGKLMNSIAQSTEDFIANSITGLVNRTKSLKDVLLDFYAEITRAVTRYIAKLIILETLGPHPGKTLGGIATPFGEGGLLGGLLGFANGGNFVVNGRGGIDNNVLSLNGQPVAKVSQGETVNVSPNGSSGDTIHISISAMDSKSVRELFMSEGSALIDSILRMKRLNRAAP